MALKELLKQRVMEKLNFSQEISDEHLKGVIQEEIMKISEEYPLLLSDKIRLNQEVFYALRRLDILQDLLEDDSVTEIMINGYKNIFPVAAMLCNLPEFMGSGFSLGDKYIAQLSTATGKSGGASQWRWCSTDHHLALVYRQISALIGIQREATETIPLAEQMELL